MLKIDLPVPLTTCHICSEDLIPHPLYAKSGTMYCRHDGDFFVQKLRGQEPVVYFVEFDEKDVPLGERNAPVTKKRVGVTLRCEQTGEIFLTIKKAADTLGLHPTSIFKHLKGERTHVKGYSFTRLTDDQVDVEALSAPANEEYSILCIETQQVFTSIRHVSQVMRIGRDIIRGVLWGYRQDAWGYHFVERGTPPHGRTHVSQEKHGSI